MGASTFEEYAVGTTPQEAFTAAVAEGREEYGNRGYTGSIAEKHNFTLIKVPANWNGSPESYAEHLIEESDSRVDDKWGPAGCILVESKPMTEEVAYATTQERYDQKGARKWETFFSIVSGESFIAAEPQVIQTFTSQTEAEKYAKEWVKRHNRSVTIKIGKRLVNGHQEIVKIHPKTKTVKSTKTMNKYLFFGWASS